MTTHARPRALPYKATMTRTKARCSAALWVFAKSATARPSCTEWLPAEIDAKAIFSLLARKPREKFPARLALGISRLVASRPTVAIARLDSPKTTEPPVKAKIETKKMSTRATNALPVNTVRNSRVVGLSSFALTTDTATTSNPKMAADAPALAMKKFS